MIGKKIDKEFVHQLAVTLADKLDTDGMVADIKNIEKLLTEGLLPEEYVVEMPDENLVGTIRITDESVEFEFDNEVARQLGGSLGHERFLKWSRKTGKAI